MSLRTKPGVTVVIPTFNRKNWLRIAIESVLSETRVPITLHVFDDASSDGTMDYVQSLASCNKNVIYTRNAETIGSLANYALALHHVRTRYFVPLADDDFLLPDFLHKAFRILEGDRSLGAAVFVTEARTEDGLVQSTYPIKRDKMRPGRMEPAEHLRTWLANGHYGWSSVLWLSETLDYVGYPYFHTRYPSDVDFQAQVFCRYPAVFVDEPASVFRLHKGQTSMTYAATLMSWANLFRRLDRRVIEFGLLPLEEYIPLRSVMADRFRESWRRDPQITYFRDARPVRQYTGLPSKQRLSNGRLQRLAVAAGFWLGDWELAFSLIDKLEGWDRRRAAAAGGPLLPPASTWAGSLHLFRGLLQFPIVSSRDARKPGFNDAALLGLRPMAAILAGLRLYECVFKRQAEEIEALSARCATMEDEREQLRARRAVMEGEVAQLRSQLSRSEAERNALLKSTSWRLTAPLRWIKRREYRSISDIR